MIKSRPFCRSLYRVTQKKTELTKSLITPEILLSLKQKFYGIMYNLCSQHLQSLNAIQQKLFVLQPLKDMFQMPAPALQADLDSPGKVLNDPPALLSDLNPPDFYLWGYLKDRVYEHNPQTIPDLKAAITAAIRAIPREECRRVIENFARRIQVCLQRRGGHLEHIFERL